MHRPLLVVAALVALGTTLLLTPGTALAASASSRAGACTGTEGVTVVVDRAAGDGSASTADVLVRCALGAPASGFDALQQAFDVVTISTSFGPQICRVAGLGTANCSGLDTWVYWQPSASGWDTASNGAQATTPKPGDVEGWRWIPDYNFWPGDGPRIPSRSVQISDGPAAKVAPGVATTVTYTITDPASTRALCQLDAGPWTTCSTATTHSVSSSVLGRHVITVRAEDAWGNVSKVSRAFEVEGRGAQLSNISVGSISSTGATVSATVNAGDSDQLAHVEYAVGDRTTAPRTAARAIAAGATTAATFDLTGLTAGATFSYRVVTTGALGTIASDWATFSTPRPAVRLRVTTPDRFAHRGERVHVDLDRLAAGETVTVRLGDVELGSANADLDGEARVTVRIPAATRTGRATLTATGSGTDRTGSVAVTVTAAETLPVSARQLRDGRWFVTVSGLEPGEEVTLKQGRTVVATGTANRLGKFGATFRTTARTSSLAVVATGSHATRTGSTSLPTASARRR